MTGSPIVPSKASSHNLYNNSRIRSDACLLTNTTTQILDNGVAVFEALCGTTMRSLDSPDFLDGVRKGNDSGREARMRWLIYFFLAARIC